MGGWCSLDFDLVMVMAGGVFLEWNSDWLVWLGTRSLGPLMTAVGISIGTYMYLGMYLVGMLRLGISVPRCAVSCWAVLGSLGGASNWLQGTWKMGRQMIDILGRGERTRWV